MSMFGLWRWCISIFPQFETEVWCTSQSFFFCPLFLSLLQDEFPEVLKWRRKPSLPAVSSSLPDLLGNSTPGLTADTTFSTHTLTGRPVHLSISIHRKWPFILRSCMSSQAFIQRQCKLINI